MMTPVAGSFHLVALLASFLARACGAVIMAALLLRYDRQYGKTYLRHWASGWVALAISLIAGGASLGLASSQPADSLTRIILSICFSVGGYLFVMWFVFGSYELAIQQPVKLKTVRNTIPVLAVFAATITLLFVGDPQGLPLRHLVAVALLSLFAAAGFGFAATIIFRRRSKSSHVGFALMAGATALYSIDQIRHIVIAFMDYKAGADVGLFRTGDGYTTLFLEGLVALGMISSLLEDEREAARLATLQIEHLAYHDALTGLPNRPLFMDRLILAIAQAERTRTSLGVFFLDLDRFKDINDSLGHSAGDMLLKELAERIRGCVRQGDTVARFGGDEFTILVQKLEHVDYAAKIAQKILDTAKIPFRVGDRDLFMATSIGISIFPNDGGDAETLVRNADAAMYLAKERGRDNYQLYAPAMNERALERLALESMLRRAMVKDELILHYQPLIDVVSREVVSLEALLRWQHPELGLLSPAHFISTAEVSGLILPIGQWVLRTACKQARIWQKRTSRPISISVNLSARQFQQMDLFAQVQSALRESGMEPSLLELEITESNAMQNAENTIRTLLELKKLGVRISMDDFGTGYSSLSYLKRFPIDTLKLDQSFVRDITTDAGDGAIATAVIAMAHSLKISVVAEGVETLGQLDFLKSRDCDRFQGFYFSRPIAPEFVEEFLLRKPMDF